MRTANVASGRPPTGSGAREPRIAFVVPIVNPAYHRIGDYAAIERVLRLTIRSLAALENCVVRVFVVVHRAPDWASDWASAGGDLARFLVIGEHPRFGPEVRFRQIDKGLKILIGATAVLETFDPDYVMPVDGDDFVRSDLAARVAEALADKADADGVIVTGGYHALMRPVGAAFSVSAAIRVGEFDRTCGSCRVFRATAVAKLLERLGLAGPWWTDVEARSNAAPVPTALLDRLDALGDEAVGLEDGAVRVLGRHDRQHVLFRFEALRTPVMAKGCGHGNHVGPRRGEVHWHRARGMLALPTFVDRFGLKGAPISLDSDPRNVLRLLAALPVSYATAVVDRMRGAA